MDKFYQLGVTLDPEKFLEFNSRREFHAELTAGKNSRAREKISPAKLNREIFSS